MKTIIVLILIITMMCLTYSQYYAVSKKPIAVIPVNGSDHINNYSERNYRKLQAIPVSVDNKYLEWGSNDPDKGTLAEMSTKSMDIVDVNIGIEKKNMVLIRMKAISNNAELYAQKLAELEACGTTYYKCIDNIDQKGR